MAAASARTSLPRYIAGHGLFEHPRVAPRCWLTWRDLVRVAKDSAGDGRGRKAPPMADALDGADRARACLEAADAAAEGLLAGAAAGAPVDPEIVRGNCGMVDRTVLVQAFAKAKLTPSHPVHETLLRSVVGEQALDLTGCSQFLLAAASLRAGVPGDAVGSILARVAAQPPAADCHAWACITYSLGHLKALHRPDVACPDDLAAFVVHRLSHAVIHHKGDVKQLSDAEMHQALWGMHQLRFKNLEMLQVLGERIVKHSVAPVLAGDIALAFAASESRDSRLAAALTQSAISDNSKSKDVTKVLRLIVLSNDRPVALHLAASVLKELIRSRALEHLSLQSLARVAFTFASMKPLSSKPLLARMLDNFEARGVFPTSVIDHRDVCAILRDCEKLDLPGRPLYLKHLIVSLDADAITPADAATVCSAAVRFAPHDTSPLMMAKLVGIAARSPTVSDRDIACLNRAYQWLQKPSHHRSAAMTDSLLAQLPPDHSPALETALHSLMRLRTDIFKPISDVFISAGLQRRPHATRPWTKGPEASLPFSSKNLPGFGMVRAARGFTHALRNQSSANLDHNERPRSRASLIKKTS
ncbi:hypothetical protein DIPPA_31654 [Diplonema papillatum]|nr:hypothetical protein DIPPA_31654 [Diplonema papillatum]